MLDAEISSDNVDELEVAWTFDITGFGPYGAAASGPLIVDGAVYFQDLASNVTALDMETGEIRWESRYETPVPGPNGPAVGWGLVFAQTGADSIVAMDLDTGDEVWSASLDGPTGAQQPVPFAGRLYTATLTGRIVSGGDGRATVRGYAGGSRGIAYALDARTGEPVWSWESVQEGFWGNPEVNSGGGIWYPPAVDTETGMTFWGTGNPAPFPGTEEFPNASSRPGPNLYTSSAVALDERGEMAWYQQVNPHDIFDHDFQAPPILASVKVDGQRRDIVIGSGKLGRVAAFDREDGEVLWDIPVGRHENDDLEELPLDVETEVFPGALGGVETPMAYADGTVYAPVVNLSSPYRGDGFDAADGTEALANIESRTDATEGTSELVAIDAATGRIAWSTQLDAAAFGGATVVNDLVFAPTFEGRVYALDRETGDVVWTYDAPAGFIAWPAVAGDTIVLATGVGQNSQLIALRVGAAT